MSPNEKYSIKYMLYRSTIYRKYVDALNWQQTVVKLISIVENKHNETRCMKITFDKIAQLVFKRTSEEGALVWSEWQALPPPICIHYIIQWDDRCANIVLHVRTNMVFLWFLKQISTYWRSCTNSNCAVSYVSLVYAKCGMDAAAFCKQNKKSVSRLTDDKIRNDILKIQSSGSEYEREKLQKSNESIQNIFQSSATSQTQSWMRSNVC